MRRPRHSWPTTSAAFPAYAAGWTVSSANCNATTMSRRCMVGAGRSTICAADPAAEIVTIAMIKLHRALAAGGYRARLTLQVHDELVLDVPREEVDDVRQL